MNRANHTREQVGHILCVILAARYVPAAEIVDCCDPPYWAASGPTGRELLDRVLSDAMRALVTVLDLEQQVQVPRRWARSSPAANPQITS